MDYSVLPLVPVIEQVLLPGLHMRIPMPAVWPAKPVFDMHRRCAVFQTLPSGEGCYDIGCEGRLTDIEESHGRGTSMLHVYGIRRIRRLEYLQLGYEYPFVTVRRSDPLHENVGPMYDPQLTVPLMFGAADVPYRSPAQAQADVGRSDHESSALLLSLLPINGREKQYCLEQNYTDRSFFLKRWAHQPRPHDTQLH